VSGRAKPRLLLVHQEPGECGAFAEHLRRNADATVEFTVNAIQGEVMLTYGHFDLAIIDAILPEMPGTQLVALAAKRKTPVLLLSGAPSESAQLRTLGYPYLERPLNLDALVAETQRVIRETRLIIGTVRASAATMEAKINALAVEMAEAHRLFDLIMARLGYNRVEWPGIKPD
jgi:DNA-binding response OmpR family regulator